MSVSGDEMGDERETERRGRGPDAGGGWSIYIYLNKGDTGVLAEEKDSWHEDFLSDF